MTPFIYRPPRALPSGNLAEPDDLSHLRWIVDEPEDLAFIAAIYEALYPDNPAFETADVLALLERRPDIAALMRACADATRAISARWPPTPPCLAGKE